VNNDLKQEAILAQLPYGIQMQRFAIIMKKIGTIVADTSN
jgi:hypothetical protein